VLRFAAIAYCYGDGNEKKENSVHYGIMHSVMPKEMLIAALFHDFGHSGGFFTNDGNNIKIAVAGLERYVTETKDDNGYTIPKAIQLVKDTRYPHSKKGGDCECSSYEHYNFMRDCLLDADMYQYCVTTMSSIVGIRQELFKHIPWDKFIAKQIDFMKSIQYRTPWGTKEAEVQRQVTIGKLERFRGLVFPPF